MKQLQTRLPPNRSQSPRSQKGHGTTGRFPSFSFNFSLAYKPQEIIYEIHSMGCELQNLNKRTME